MNKAVLIMDRHRFDADLDPNFHFDADPGSVKTMPIHMSVLTQVLQIENKAKTFTFYHS
jgi:hypothetical protein